LAGLFVAGGIFYGIFFTPFLQIRHVEVEGNQKVSTEKLQELTRQHIPKKFGIFEINHLFLANVSKVNEEIKIAFPEIETLVVDARFPNKIKITVQERGRVAVWCQEKTYTVEVGDSPSAETGGEEQATRLFRECFALDSNGVIFPAEPAITSEMLAGQAGREVVISGGKENATVGNQVVQPELLVKILSLQEEFDSSLLFREVGLRVSSFRVVSAERVNIGISEGWEIYINPREDTNWQTTKAQLVLEQEIPFEKRSSLEYIDLRFGDQAYIKYR